MIVTAGSRDCLKEAKDMVLANKLEVSEKVFVNQCKMNQKRKISDWKDINKTGNSRKMKEYKQDRQQERIGTKYRTGKKWRTEKEQHVKTEVTGEVAIKAEWEREEDLSLPKDPGGTASTCYKTLPGTPCHLSDQHHSEYRWCFLPLLSLAHRDLKSHFNATVVHQWWNLVSLPTVP